MPDSSVWAASVPSYLIQDGDVWRFVAPPETQMPPVVFVGCEHSSGWSSRGSMVARCAWCNAKEPVAEVQSAA